MGEDEVDNSSLILTPSRIYGILLCPVFNQRKGSKGSKSKLSFLIPGRSNFDKDDREIKTSRKSLLALTELFFLLIFIKFETDPHESNFCTEERK